MSRKALLIVFALLLALVGVSGAQDGEPLVIGVVTDQTTGLAIYGYELEFGFKLGMLYELGIDPTEYESIDAALSEAVAGGRPIEIKVVNYEGDTDRAVSLARELIEVDGAEILVGAPSSGVTIALQQVAADNEVLLFAAPGASPAITGAGFHPNTYRVCRNTVQDSLALAAFAAEGLGEKWVILAADYDFGRSSAVAFEATLAAFGVEWVQAPIYAPLETTDFTPYLQEVLNSGAEVLLPIWAGDGAVTLYQQINELGVDDSVVVVGAFNSNDVVAFASTDANIGNVSWIVYHYTFPQTEANDWLVEKHQAIYADYPDLFTECGFATAQAIVKAVNGSEGATLPEDLAPQLEGMTLESAKGTIYIRPGDHQALVPMYVAELVTYTDPEQKFYNLLAEVSAFDAAPPCALVDPYADRCELDAAFMAELAEME
jgi:branched-chain amino acid transport system substrate-binding protein